MDAAPRDVFKAAASARHAHIPLPFHARDTLVSALADSIRLPPSLSQALSIACDSRDNRFLRGGNFFGSEEKAPLPREPPRTEPPPPAVAPALKQPSPKVATPPVPKR
ncbi:hypothetical protein AB1Y20_000370 [Prymnesium parvum]|uniref:Uncharacterized protein n=1 Tax=Prymnesium parvum TaxID=97485 RepID=A0AB34K8W4_PRYPA